MVKTTQKSWFGYNREPNYASGPVTSAVTYAQTNVTTSASHLTSFEMPISGSRPKMPYIKIKREVVREIGGDQYKKQILGGAYDIANGDIETYIQSPMAVSMALSATIGAIPDSIMFHWETYDSPFDETATPDATRFESYGCVSQKYTLNAKTDDLPTHQTEWKPYGMAIGKGIATEVITVTAQAFDNSQPITNSEMSIVMNGGLPIGTVSQTVTSATSLGMSDISFLTAITATLATHLRNISSGQYYNIESISASNVVIGTVCYDADSTTFELISSPYSTTVAINNILDLKLTIDNTYIDKPEIGNYGIANPWLEKREVSLDLEFLSDEQDLYLQQGEHVSNLITNIDMELSVTGWTTITITNMYIENSEAPEQMPEPGIYKYKMTLKDGEGFTITHT